MGGSPAGENEDMSEDSDCSSESPVEAMQRAVADLWSQVIRTGNDHLIFYDHDGNPARLRYEEGMYRIGWVETAGDESQWDEPERRFDSPREAALRAFQGPERGR